MSLTIKTKNLSEIYRNLGIEEKGKVQQFLDKTVSQNLQKYVSFSSGIMEKSIKIATVPGSGKIIINVPYARFQSEGKVMIGTGSHSPWARRGEKKIVTSRNLKYHNSDLKRGAKPWERMKADKKESILIQTANYARRIKNG